MVTSGGSGLVVLGMHRSGTSAASQVGISLGLNTAPRPALIKATPDNAHGFFEAEALVRRNDAILARAGGSWHVPPPRRELRRSRHWDIPRRNAAELRDLLPTDRWLWKDPRLSLTLHLWERWLSQPRAHLLCVRHPLAVAASLLSRDNFDQSHSIALWERYTSDACRVSVGRPTFVLVYEELLAAPAAVIEELEEFLVAVHVITANEASNAAHANTVRPESNHAGSFVTSAEDDPQTRQACATYDQLRDLRGGHIAFPPAVGRSSADSDAVLDRKFRTARSALPLRTRIRNRIPPSVHACADVGRASRAARAATGQSVDRTWPLHR